MTASTIYARIPNPVHGLNWLHIAAILGASLGATPQAHAGTVIPTNGMVITEDTTFEPGTYNLPNGVSIGASGIILDMNGAVLQGTGFANYGVTCIGFDAVTIQNGVLKEYYYGMRVENGSSIEIRDNDLSDNWVDPNSLEAPAPFLNINVGPNLGDTTNLGGGLFLCNISASVVAGNTMRDQENGVDLYFVTGSTIADNDCSNNTGWGIHLHGSSENIVTSNIADHCTRPGLGDSAGVLVVMASNNNEFLNNSFQFGGDGFFIGNEHGCPSNDNLVQGNDGSNAGANAFEATFSAGNQFIDNIANGSNYGFWLGYSHSGNVIRGNEIRANNVNGIEIEHGQDNIIEDNVIVGNGGKAIVLRTDGQVHFPSNQFPCLDLPNQAASTGYTITGNTIQQNFAVGMQLLNTTSSLIANNIFAGNVGGTATSNGAGNVWSYEPLAGLNIVGGPTLGGNFWDNYSGEDLDEDGLGDTELPYTNSGLIAAPGDIHPLIGEVDIDEVENPRRLCTYEWLDLGRNRRANGQVFDTANGAHFATDGIELFLLEGTNSNRLSLFDATTDRYEPKASVPETVWDGGDLQYAAGLYYATVGVAFDPATGGGKGSKLYAYNPGSNSWSSRAPSTVGITKVANEALAYDSVGGLLYATVVQTMNGGDPSLLRRLAIYDPAIDAWIGTTSPSDVVFGAASEAEYLNGKIYVWRGLLNGGAVNGSDSQLLVYDIATDNWSITPTLQESGVIPGFRSGAIDIWGVAITCDPVRNVLFLIGGEANRQVYVYDVASQTWAATPTAVYDGGWGDAMEYVGNSDKLYQIDGRNATGAPQGTAVLAKSCIDLNGDGNVGPFDLAALLAGWGSCAESCCPTDFNEDGQTGPFDLALLLAAWGPCQ